MGINTGNKLEEYMYVLHTLYVSSCSYSYYVE